MTSPKKVCKTLKTVGLRPQKISIFKGKQNKGSSQRKKRNDSSQEEDREWNRGNQVHLSGAEVDKPLLAQWQAHTKCRKLTIQDLS